MKKKSLKIIGLLFLGLAINCESITDIYPPELELLNPTDDVLSTDSITFLVDATDNIGVDRVTFSLRDGYTGWGLDTTLKAEPYEISVTSIQSRVEIELEITGFDAAGNFDKLNRTFEITTARIVKKESCWIATATAVRKAGLEMAIAMTKLIHMRVVISI